MQSRGTIWCSGFAKKVEKWCRIQYTLNPYFRRLPLCYVGPALLSRAKSFLEARLIPG
jgi:hypothetical protein